MEQLELLWHLQQSDLTVLGLEKELEDNPLLSTVNNLKDKYEKEKSHLDQLSNDLQERQKKIKRMDLDLQKADEEIKTSKKKLYGGEISKVKEVEQMEKRLEQAEKEKDTLENQIIEQIEEAEEAEKVLEKQRKVFAEHEKTLKQKQDELNKKVEEINRKISEAKIKRDEISEKVNEDYLEKYKVLTNRPDKKGVARVENDICEGCRVYISSAQRGKLYNPQTMLYCENCGRLLVKFREDVEKEKLQNKES